MPGQRSNTPTPSTTKTTSSGSRVLRSPKSVHRVHLPKGRRAIPGRLIVRRIPDLNHNDHGQQACSTPGGFTRSSPPPTRHRDRQQNPPRPRDHRTGPCRPQELCPGSSTVDDSSGQRSLAGLAVIAFNLTRAAATLTGPALAKSPTATVRRTLITVPARIASSARRLTCTYHRLALENRVEHPVPQPVPPTSPDHRLTERPTPLDTKHPPEQPDTEAGSHRRPHPRTPRNQGTQPNSSPQPQSIGGSRLLSGPVTPLCSAKTYANDNPTRLRNR